MKSLSLATSALAIGTVLAAGGLSLGISPAEAQQVNAAQQQSQNQSVLPAPRQQAQNDQQQRNWLGETKAEERARLARDFRALDREHKHQLERW